MIPSQNKKTKCFKTPYDNLDNLQIAEQSPTTRATPPPPTKAACLSVWFVGVDGWNQARYGVILPIQRQLNPNRCEGVMLKMLHVHVLCACFPEPDSAFSPRLF